MKSFTSGKLKKWDKLMEKFVLNKIWKKKFSNIPVNNIIGCFFNMSCSNRKIFGFSRIDFLLYIILLKIEHFNITSFHWSLFQLQKESILVRLFGLVYQKMVKKFWIYYLENFKWKNDLRLNENFRFLFEKQVNYLNKIIGFIFNYSKTNHIIYNILKPKDKKKCYEFPYCFAPKIKIQGVLSYIYFKLF
jgi:hypothetical protein